LENLVVNPTFWQGKRVVLTGHTGFKGGWMSVWLAQMGAKVFGFSLEPRTTPSFFEVTGVEDQLSGHEIGDLLDYKALSDFVSISRPDIVFHMAAQALVRRAYFEPLETISTNILGTANLLQACRGVKSLKSIVNVTSDKCYHNDEVGTAFVESDRMGGHDVYSASKGAVELVSHAFGQCFFKNGRTSLANVRAGNVFGGGDWSEDRLVPDYLRAAEKNEALIVRFPNAVRPWQHVLEPLSGYLILAQKLFENGDKFSGGWNFGPTQNSVKTVQWLVDYLIQANGGEAVYENTKQPKEAHYLALDSRKSAAALGWTPKWAVEKALDNTISWERARLIGANMLEVTTSQIEEYQFSEVS